MPSPKLQINSTDQFRRKLDAIVVSGKPYTIKIEIKDVKGLRYATEFNILQGGEQYEAMQKGITACFHLCDNRAASVLLQDINYMATA